MGSTWDRLMSGGTATEEKPSTPSKSAWERVFSRPKARNDERFVPDDDFRQGILDAADELGVDPVHLATAISYETGGTFDPMKSGPTTKWGQHRGLIQFGEPQAKEYGVDWSDPVGSQLGREGAVVNYLRKTGVEPGMGLLDIYSAINAGGVGRYDRSDAHAGGAPGTVRDKVENQMAGHVKNAMKLLGREPEKPKPNKLWLDF